ncbi:helix-turn-helix domain-containing protein [Novosphingopyxis baekryungensis]|uniref:helix-turn-helix domain-containing protein n=1 Tax=Novosphingopyxis baekryungensis TaxID=279369 RepID=UPI0009FCA06D
MDRNVNPLAHSILDVCELTSLSRSSIYELINRGELEVISIGRRRLVLARSVEKLLGIKSGTAGE